MILVDGTEISKATVSKYKFGGDPMAEYLFELSLDGCADDTVGDADFGLWMSKFGKRLLLSDSQGSVWVQKYESEAKAEEDWNDTLKAYNDYCGQEDIY